MEHESVSAMNDGTPLGRIIRLWRYPIKSLRAETLASAQIRRDGLSGDRGRALFVTTAGHARHGKPYRGKEHELLHTTSSGAQAARIARERGVDLQAAGGGPYFDAAPVSLIIDTWLAQAERLAGMSLDPLRFRPNVFVCAAPSFCMNEHDLTGARLAAGTVRLVVRKPIKRCVTITYDIATGAPAPHLLGQLAQSRDTILGVYADVLTAGTVEAGDMLRLVAD